MSRNPDGKLVIDTLVKEYYENAKVVKKHKNGDISYYIPLMNLSITIKKHHTLKDWLFKYISFRHLTYYTGARQNTKNTNYE